MKKIGITCYPTVGGSGIIATELGKLLAKKGYEIHFITFSMPYRLDCVNPEIYYHEVELNHYPVFQSPPYDIALAAKMAEVIDREKLDILHVHYAMPHAICAILAKDIAEHDVKIAEKIAYVLSGGRLKEGTLIDEQLILDLEREAFLSLIGEPKTQQRMQHMLVKGKPLRN